MGRNSQFYRLLALQVQGVEHHQQTYWQVRTLFSSGLGLSKLHRFTTAKERSTQDGGLQIHKARQQQGVQHMEGPNT